MSLAHARALLVAATVLTVSTTGAAQPEHAHAHGKSKATHAPKLTLDDGKKWQTDAALRDGMVGIRDAVQAQVERIHGGQMTPAEFAALGAKIDAHVANIFANCKLPPAADQNLHLVLVDVMDGSKVLKEGPGDRTPGVVKIIRALEAYGAHFDHPGWVGVKH